MFGLCVALDEAVGAVGGKLAYAVCVGEESLPALFCVCARHGAA